MIVLEDDLPDSVKNLQQYFGDGTSNDLTNVFYKELGTEQGMVSLNLYRLFFSNLNKTRFEFTGSNSNIPETQGNHNL